MSDEKLAAKILEVAQELYELREGNRSDEDLDVDGKAYTAFEILRDEIENW
jgi:hypothetical protein